MLIFFDFLFILFLCFCLISSIQGKFKELSYVLVCVAPFHIFFYNYLFINSPVLIHLTFWKELQVILFFISALIFSFKKRDVLKVRLRKYDFVILAYIFLQVIYVFKSPSFKVGLYGFLLNCSGFLLFISTIFAEFKSKDLRRLINALLIVAIIPCLISIYEFYFANKLLFVNKDTETQVFFRDVTNRVRAGSIFSSFLVFSFYLVLPFAFVVSRLIYDKRYRRSLLGIVSFIFFTLAYLTPQTRSIIVFIFISVIVFFIFGIRNRTLRLVSIISFAGIAVAVIGRLIIYLFQFDESSSMVKLLAWNNCYECILNNIFGLGLGTAGIISDNFQTELPLGRINCESWFLQMGVEIGIIGILAYIAFIVYTLIEFSRLSKLVIDDQHRWMLFGLKVIFLTMTLSGFALHAWAYPATIPFYLFFGSVRNSIQNSYRVFI